MNGTSYTADAGIKVTVNPLTFIGSAAFALFTVFVSVRRPAKIAGMVSAIEAIRYTENDTAAFGKHRAKDKKSTRGGKLHFMALANLSRSRKRTILVIVSMTLSLVLFNTVFTLSSGFDIDKYIAKFMDTDFVLSTADYFQFQFEKAQVTFRRILSKQSNKMKVLRMAAGSIPPVCWKNRFPQNTMPFSAITKIRMEIPL